MMEHTRNTIVALSSGKLPAGIAIVRVSGDDTCTVLTTLAGPLPDPRAATLRSIRAPDGEPIDTGLVLFFPTPNSFTGEDVAEFHIHGGRAVVAALIEIICSLNGCRLAEPGEFSRRALLNGKIDLTGAEAIADIISAETSAQHLFAVANARGEQAALYQTWRATLIQLRAQVEADLDFADEDDVPDDVAKSVRKGIRRLSDAIRAHIALYRKAEIVQEGFRVVLLGAPNAGKSSLLNALARRDVAIVSEEAGTTRDAIDVALDLDGLKVILTDTAGLRDVAGLAEMKGIARARARAEDADLVLWLSDTDWQGVPPLAHPAIVKVATKSDLSPAAEGLKVSAVTGEGLDGLLRMISRAAATAAPAEHEVVPWKIRHVNLLTEACERLELALSGQHRGLELVSEEMLLASQAMGKISGHIDVDHLLDEIFSTFCIGK